MFRMHRRFALLIALVLLVVGSVVPRAAAQPLEPASPQEPTVVPQEPAAQLVTPSASVNKVFLPIIVRGRIIGDGSVTGKPTDDEMDLIKLLNDYRQQHGLPRVTISRTMMLVAQTHVKDLVENGAYTGTCNLHSWSNKGNWSPVCYTGDPSNYNAMWNKPREISNGAYTGNGFEIAYMTTTGATPSQAMNAWKNSPDHNAVILEQPPTWSDMRWPAIGAGMYKGFAVVWFGDKTDPLGTVVER